MAAEVPFWGQNPNNCSYLSSVTSQNASSLFCKKQSVKDTVSLSFTQFRFRRAISVHQTRRKAKLPIQSKERPKETMYNFCPFRGHGLSRNMSKSTRSTFGPNSPNMSWKLRWKVRPIFLAMKAAESPTVCSRWEYTQGGTAPKWSNSPCHLAVPWNRPAHRRPKFLPSRSWFVLTGRRSMGYENCPICNIPRITCSGYCWRSSNIQQCDANFWTFQDPPGPSAVLLEHRHRHRPRLPSRHPCCPPGTVKMVKSLSSAQAAQAAQPMSHVTSPVSDRRTVSLPGILSASFSARSSGSWSSSSSGLFTTTLSCSIKLSCKELPAFYKPKNFRVCRMASASLESCPPNWQVSTSKNSAQLLTPSQFNAMIWLCP